MYLYSIYFRPRGSYIYVLGQTSYVYVLSQTSTGWAADNPWVWAAGAEVADTAGFDSAAGNGGDHYDPSLLMLQCNDWNDAAGRRQRYAMDETVPCATAA